MYKKTISASVLIGLLWFLMTLLGLTVAENYHKLSLTELNNRNYERSVEFADKAIRYNQKEPVYFIDRAKSRLGLLAQKQMQEGPEDYVEDKEDILRDLETAYELNPENVVTKRNSVPIYYYLAIKDYSNSLQEKTIDDNYIDIAADFYNVFINEYPSDLGVVAQAAGYQRNLGLDDDYGRSLEKIKELRPDIIEWYFD